MIAPPETARRFTGKDGLETVLGEIVDFALAITGADFGNIQLIDPATGDLRIRAQRGFPEWWVEYWNTIGCSNGACHAAFKAGNRIVIDNVERSPIFAGTTGLDIQLAAGVRALQSTPIVSRTGSPLGMFSTHWKTSFTPDERMLTLLDSLARQAADMVELAQAESALAHANAQLLADLESMAKLQELSTLFVREGDTQSVLDKMVEVAMEFSDADFGTIQLMDPESGDLKLVAHKNFPPWWVSFWETTPHGQGACGAALEIGERVIIEDVEQSPVFIGTPALDTQLRAGVRAVQSTPLVSRAGKLLGMLATHYKWSRRPNQRALGLIDLLARQAADIIDRGQLNEALARAKAAAETANHAKSAFLANMSHEIRTPLNVVIGLANLLERDIKDTRQHERLRRLLENSEHLLTVINDVLELSKIETQELTLDHLDFALDSVIAKVRRMLELKAQEKGLALSVEVAPELCGVFLRGDALRLTQVLLNLCSNAIKFTHQGYVMLKVALAGEYALGFRIQFSISDSGIGIGPEDQTRVFQAFEQADPSLSRNYGGSGLGLAISQRLVKRMGGNIVVNSELGRGSTFSFDLMMERGASIMEIEHCAKAIPSNFHGARILVAEDHPQSQEILLDMLGELNCDGDVACDGREAIELAQMHAYDAILMDMHMPHVDGLVATRAIRQIRQHASTPIIALTANAFAEDRQRCLDAGMDSHVSKPVTPATLASALADWLPHTCAAGCMDKVCDNEIGRALEEIPGITMGPLWRRSDEHVARYGIELLRFAESQLIEVAQLRVHLASREYDRAQTLAHRLGGIAGLLGATRIEVLARKMERLIREDGKAEQISDIAAQCEAELADLGARLRPLPTIALAPPQEKPASMQNDVCNDRLMV